MFANVGMVGRALEGEIQGHFQPSLLRRFPVMGEVLHRPQGRVDGLVSSFARADGPGTSQVVGVCAPHVVWAFASGATDGVDGWQIDDVEAKRLDVRQEGFCIRERAGLPVGPGGSRKKLVPGAEDRSGSIRINGDLVKIARGAGPIRIPGRQIGQARLQGGGDRRFRRLGQQRLFRRE